MGPVSSPLDLNYTAARFSVAGRTSWFKSQNAARPSTNIVLTGPEAPTYLWGLAIVPLVLLLILLTWLIAMIVLGCLRQCLDERKCGISIPRRRLWGCLGILFLAATISWFCSFGFALATLPVNTNTGDDLAAVATLLGSVSASIGDATAEMVNANAALVQVNKYCNATSNPNATEILTKINTKLYNTSTNLIAIANNVIPIANQTSETVVGYSEGLRELFAIRTIVYAVLSGVLAFLVLACFIVALVGWQGRIERIKWFNTQCCCRGCCTPVVFIAGFSIVITIILAGVLHAIGLLITDLCDPNVNTSLNRVIGGFSGYAPFATYYGTNLTEMCENTTASSNTSVANLPAEVQSSTAPTELAALCFYQTCDANNTFSQQVVGRLSSMYTEFTDDSSYLNATITQDIALFNNSGNCTDSLKALGTSYARATSHAFRALSFVSCSTVNPIYSSAFYNDVCQEQVTFSVDMFNSWICGCIFLMVALAFWLVFRARLHQADAGPTAKGELLDPPAKRPDLEPNVPQTSFDSNKPTADALVTSGTTTSSPSDQAEYDSRFQQVANV